MRSPKEISNQDGRWCPSGLAKGRPYLTQALGGSTQVRRWGYRTEGGGSRARIYKGRCDLGCRATLDDQGRDVGVNNKSVISPSQYLYVHNKEQSSQQFASFLFYTYFKVGPTGTEVYTIRAIHTCSSLVLRWGPQVHSAPRVFIIYVLSCLFVCYISPCMLPGLESNLKLMICIQTQFCFSFSFNYRCFHWFYI